MTGATTHVSTDAARIALPASGMRTASGTASPVSAEALVRATQTYSRGTKIEVAFKSADLATGAFACGPTCQPAGVALDYPSSRWPGLTRQPIPLVAQPPAPACNHELDRLTSHLLHGPLTNFLVLI